MPLQVEEHPAAVLVHQVDGRRTGAGEQHRPDLERPDPAGERLHQRPGLFQVRHVEADDQPVEALRLLRGGTLGDRCG